MTPRYRVLAVEDDADTLELMRMILRDLPLDIEPAGTGAEAIAALERETFDTILDAGGAWVGTPDEIVAQAKAYQEQVGGFEIASLQVNFATLPFAEAERSVQLFGREVLPRVQEI